MLVQIQRDTRNGRLIKLKLAQDKIFRSWNNKIPISPQDWDSNWFISLCRYTHTPTRRFLFTTRHSFHSGIFIHTTTYKSSSRKSNALIFWYTCGAQTCVSTSKTLHMSIEIRHSFLKFWSHTRCFTTSLCKNKTRQKYLGWEHMKNEEKA